MLSAQDWLLEESNPAIRYRTLANIKREANIELMKKAYDAVWEDKAILRMLQRQDGNGLWEMDRAKYGSFLSLRYLTAFAEYGLTRDPRLDRAVQKALEELSVTVADDPSGCATPLVLRALVMLGYHENTQVCGLIQTFSSAQLYDGGFMCKRLLCKKPQRKSCYKASLAALLLYAECKKKEIIIDNTEMLVDYFLRRDVFYSSNKTVMFNEGRHGWRYIDNFFPVEPMRIGLPLIVEALAALGAGNDAAVMEAWSLLQEKGDTNGRYPLEGTLTRQPCSFGPVGKANKWVTYYALLAQAEKYDNLQTTSTAN